jgi:hypothetical protein
VYTGVYYNSWHVRSGDDSFTTEEVVLPSGETLRLKVERPKSNLPVDLTPYYFVKVRCGREDCNRLHSLAERGNKAYCSNRCYILAKRQRSKLRKALS